jgi:hypothetical protein
MSPAATATPDEIERRRQRRNQRERERRARNPEAARAACRRWIDRHPERHAARTRRWLKSENGQRYAERREQLIKAANAQALLRTAHLITRKLSQITKIELAQPTYRVIDAAGRSQVEAWPLKDAAADWLSAQHWMAEQQKHAPRPTTTEARRTSRNRGQILTPQAIHSIPTETTQPKWCPKPLDTSSISA